MRLSKSLAPRQPLGPSGAPDLGSAIHPGQSQRPAAEMGAAGLPAIPIPIEKSAALTMSQW
jgi:hypothetical protein